VDQERSKYLSWTTIRFLREGIVGAINSQSDMVLIGEASNVQEAVEKLRIYRPDRRALFRSRKGPLFQGSTS
jgi:hypothetical protein